MYVADGYMKDAERDELYHLHAQFCQALSDPKRLLIINELYHGERSVGELAGLLGMRQANLSQHLALMRERGLVVPRRQGAAIFYSLADPRIYQAIGLLRDVMAEQLQKRNQIALQAAQRADS